MKTYVMYTSQYIFFGYYLIVPVFEFTNNCKHKIVPERLHYSIKEIPMYSNVNLFYW